MSIQYSILGYEILNCIMSKWPNSAHTESSKDILGTDHFPAIRHLSGLRHCDNYVALFFVFCMLYIASGSFDGFCSGRENLVAEV